MRLTCRTSTGRRTACASAGRPLIVCVKKLCRQKEAPFCRLSRFGLETLPEDLRPTFRKNFKQMYLVKKAQSCGKIQGCLCIVISPFHFARRSNHVVSMPHLGWANKCGVYGILHVSVIEQSENTHTHTQRHSSVRPT
jgi:hypothetical protein